MKRSTWLLIALSLLVPSAQGQEPRGQFPDLSGPYLGQKPPGMIPEIFAPGIISTGLMTRDMAMTPDGREIYFCVSIANYKFATILTTRLINGRWTAPEVMKGMENPEHMNIEPCISADGKKFYFASNRPDRAKNEVSGEEDIWVMDRTGDGWGEPYNLGPPVDSEQPEFFPSITNDGTLYFTRLEKGGQANAIYRSRLKDGRYQEPERLPVEVNSGQDRYNAFIAPDESYIIVPVYGRKDSYGGTDYYVVFRDPEGAWSEPVNMGAGINTRGPIEYSASVSPDGKYLFFMSSRVLPKDRWPERLSLEFLKDLLGRPGNGNSSIYWVSAGIIDELRPKSYK